SVRQDESADAKPSHHAGGKHDRTEVVPFVEMNAPRQYGDPFARGRADDETPGVTHDIRCRPVRQFIVGCGRRVDQGIREVAEARTEDDRSVGECSAAAADVGGGLLDPLPHGGRAHDSLSYGTPRAPGARDWPMKPA